MNLDKVGPGENIPHGINVTIEIPAHSDPVKYEIDKEAGTDACNHSPEKPCF